MGEYRSIETDARTARLYVPREGTAGEPGVVVLHPWWGLNKDVVAYADRLADAGFAVVAPDMFDGEVATTIEGAERLAHGADEEAINGIVLATVDRLIASLGEGAKIAALGFSFGAHWAIWGPAQREQVVASVLYYGTTGDNLTATTTPVLGHFAENDPYETPEWVGEFESTLRGAGREVTIHHYPGTGHWFAEPSRDAYVESAANLAFDRTVAFLREQLGRAAT